MSRFLVPLCLAVMSSGALTGCAALLEAPLVDPKDQGDAMPDAEQDVTDMMGTTGEHGEPCMFPSDCLEGLVCAGSQDAFRCMKRCDVPGALCDTGEVCTALAGTDASNAICYLGGSVDVGERCDTNLECELGALCFGAAQDRYCLEACAVGQEECDSPRDACTIPEGNTTGYCQSQVGSSCLDSTKCSANRLECSTAYMQDTNSLQYLFTSPACTTTACTVGQSCAQGSGYCVEVPAQSTKELPVCVRRCELDSECRFQVGERCWSREACVGRPDALACQDFLPQSVGLCMHEDTSFSL